MQYVKNQQLVFHPNTPANWQGNPFEGKEFKYERNPFRPDWTALLKMLFTANPKRKEKKAARDWTPAVSPYVGYLEDREQNWVSWLGHACFLIQLNGVRFLTDPQLTDMPFVPRRVHPPFSYEDIRGVDYLLLSHDHRDHADEKCIRAICANNDIKKILCPLKLSNLIGKWVGDTPIEEAGWYQVFDTVVDGVRVTFLPAHHWCRRGLTDLNRALWGSFMLEDLGAAAGAEQSISKSKATTSTVYFGGDSAKTSYWADIGAMFSNIDLAMLGIGAYAPDFMMQEVHANPEEAWRGFEDLGARRFFPMHHGTYDLSWEPASEPLARVVGAAEAAGRLGSLIQGGLNAPIFLNREIR